MEDRVVSFFPDKRVSDQAYWQEMRVEHLLTMSTGHAADPLAAASRQEDWVQAILDTSIEHEPGTFFLYNNGASYLLSAIMQRVTGQTLHQYLQTRLYEPLGIRNAAWMTCPRGISRGGSGLSLTTEDIAKFGQLYLQRGNWNGKQIIPEAWVEEATSYKVSTANREKPDSAMGYGYQFWRSRHGSYRAVGAFGQYCLVLPEHDAVIAMTAGTGDMQGMLDQVWKHLLPAMQDHPLPADESACEKLAHTAAALAYPPTDTRVEASIADNVSGKRYMLDDNKMMIQAVEWNFQEDASLVKAWGPRGELQIRCGTGYWAEGMTLIGNEPERMLASGGWQSADTYVMSWRLVEAAFSEVYTCVFAEDRVKIRVQSIHKGNESIVIEGRTALVT